MHRGYVVNEGPLEDESSRVANDRIEDSLRGPTMGLSDHEQRTLQELEDTFSPERPQQRAAWLTALHRHKTACVGVGFVGVLVGLLLVVVGVRMDGYLGVMIAVVGYGISIYTLDVTLPRPFRLPRFGRSDNAG
jgi:hypothetical protein